PLHPPDPLRPPPHRLDRHPRQTRPPQRAPPARRMLPALRLRPPRQPHSLPRMRDGQGIISTVGLPVPTILSNAMRFPVMRLFLVCALLEIAGIIALWAWGNPVGAGIIWFSGWLLFQPMLIWS